MDPVLLVRKELASKYELRHVEEYFPVQESRMTWEITDVGFLSIAVVSQQPR